MILEKQNLNSATESLGGSLLYLPLMGWSTPVLGTHPQKKSAAGLRLPARHPMVRCSYKWLQHPSRPGNAKRIVEPAVNLYPDKREYNLYMEGRTTIGTLNPWA